MALWDPDRLSRNVAQLLRATRAFEMSLEHDARTQERFVWRKHIAQPNQVTRCVFVRA